MPRGRHRQSPPLHELLVPAVIAGGAFVCAAGAWLVGEPGFSDAGAVGLRGITAAVAVAAISGAVVLRMWDTAAGRHVQELKAQQTSAEWRAEERQAELEEALDEAREERDKIRNRVLDQQATLARLRNEHAALLRRYAHAEAERARALESRRKLEIEGGEPAKALTSGATDHRQASGAPTPLTYLQANQALIHLGRNYAAQKERREEARRRREEQERKEEQRLAEQRGRERARAAAAARQGPSKPASPPGLAPGGFDFFGTGPGGRKRHGRQQRQELPDEVGGRAEGQEEPGWRGESDGQEVSRELPDEQGTRKTGGTGDADGTGVTPKSSGEPEVEAVPEPEPEPEPGAERQPESEPEHAAPEHAAPEYAGPKHAGPEGEKGDKGDKESWPEAGTGPESGPESGTAPEAGPGTSHLRSAS